MRVKNIISLGAGVQSTTLSLMAEFGEITPKPDCAIFADTQWESQLVYNQLDWIDSIVSFPIYRVTAGDIKQAHLDGLNTTGQRFASMPLYTSGGGQGRRQCTNEYKIVPIRKEIRRLLGLKKGQHVPKDTVINQWIGISYDEIVRMKPSRDKWINNTFPLIDLRMTRYDCMQWLNNRYPERDIVKSSCIGCPYHNNSTWRELKNNDPESMKDAEEFDKRIRHGGSRLRGMKEQQYVHPKLIPLNEVDFRSLEDMGQENLFNNECEGMCGV